MFGRAVASIAIAFSLFAPSAASATADTLTAVKLTGDCTSLTITAAAINLRPGTKYQVNYSVVQTGAPADPQPRGTIAFTATAGSQTVSQTGNWNPPLTTSVTLHDGNATLASSGSTVEIPPLTLSCGTPAPSRWGIVARAIHVLAVVVWIGGVWLVTTVLLPAMMQKQPENWTREFYAIERRFAFQARIAALLVLLSGLYMLYQYDFWRRFADPYYWWMHFMVGVWLLAAALLFVVEPSIIGRTIRQRATTASEGTFIRIMLMRRVMVALLLLAIFAAVGGSHGLF